MSIPRLILGDVQLVYCAEPEPLNYACLVRNVVDNGFRGLVMPDRVAIGSENTVVRMLRGKSPGGHRVVNADEPVKRETIEVRSRTLDTWCDELGIDIRQVTFIKVDAQGSELHVLRGASRLLACPHITWQLEVDEALLRSQGDRTDSLFAMLQTHFTHFIDLNKAARGPRVARMEMLPDALSYLRDTASHTDILVFAMPALMTDPTQ
jgi:FkbM family methyltransferase